MAETIALNATCGTCDRRHTYAYVCSERRSPRYGRVVPNSRPACDYYHRRSEKLPPIKGGLEEMES